MATGNTYTSPLAALLSALTATASASAEPAPPRQIKLDLTKGEVAALALDPDSLKIDTFEIAHPGHCEIAPDPDPTVKFGERVLRGLDAIRRSQEAVTAAKRDDFTTNERMFALVKTADDALFGVDKSTLSKEEKAKRAVEIFEDIRSVRSFTDRLAAILSVDFLCSACAIDAHTVLLPLSTEQFNDESREEAEKRATTAATDFFTAFETALKDAAEKVEKERSPKNGSEPKTATV